MTSLPDAEPLPYEPTAKSRLDIARSRRARSCIVAIERAPSLLLQMICPDVHCDDVVVLEIAAGGCRHQRAGTRVPPGFRRQPCDHAEKLVSTFEHPIHVQRCDASELHR